MHGIIYRHIGRTGLGWIDGQKSPVFRRGKSGNPTLIAIKKYTRRSCLYLQNLNYGLSCNTNDKKHVRCIFWYQTYITDEYSPVTNH